MKIAHGGQGNVQDSNGVQTTSTFNIARTPHMFRMMSSGLYSDKIGAVLREVGCNAMDAHIMAGTPELPFQVKLPSALDPTFYVKDWGPGLDDRETRELYTTYGWSSKQQRDDVTGAFGLGSKSPFAYTLENEDNSDGFTVESVKDGVKRIYTCYIGEDGAPAISRLYEGPADSDWSHGVKVTFPVQAKDVAEFHEKAKEIYRWFTIQPEILGLNGKLEPLAFKMKADFFALGRDRGSDQAAVIMGNVRYPINAQRLRDLSKTEEALLSSGIHLWVPMGTVMMTPSREELEYTDRTRKGVKEWLGKASLNVANTVREAVTVPEPTKWAWFRKIQTYAESLPFGVSIRLAEFLEAAGMDKAGIDDVMKSVRDKYAEVPHWLGNGIAGPKQQFLKDPDTGRPLWGQLDPNAETRGHRAWLYTVSKTRDSGVAKREILGGTTRVSSEKNEPVHVPFTANAKCFFADGPLADAKVKALVREGGVEQAILIMPCKGVEMGFAKEVAERFTTEGDFDGFATAPTSVLPIPEEVLESRKRRKEQREKSPREFFSETEIKFQSLQTNTMVDTTLGELGDGDLFYVCANHVDNYRKANYWAADSEGPLRFDGREREEVFTAMRTVMEALGLPVSGFIIIDGEARAKKLKLAEQGFVSFLPWLRKHLKDEANWATLTANINRTPTVNFEQMYHADDYGWLGIFGHHKVTNSAFWQAMQLNLALTDLVKMTNAFVAESGSGDEDDDEVGMSAAQAALMKLASKVQGIDINTSELTKRTYYEVKNEFISKRPMFAALQENTMVTWMREEPMRAIGMLCAIVAQEQLQEALNKTKKPAAAQAEA